MGVSLWVNKPACYFTKPIRLIQPATISWMGNEYQARCIDAVRLGSKGRYGSFHLWIDMWVAGKLCDPLLAHAIPERLSDESLMIKHYANLCLLYFTLWDNWMKFFTSV